MKYLLLALLLTACATPSTPQPPAEQPNPTPVQDAFDCTMVTEKLALKNQTVNMPAKGNFVLESHLVAEEDAFAAGVWPKTDTDKIQAHLDLSCKYLRAQFGGDLDCAKVFNNKYVKAWTPAEPTIGKGSVGNLRPPLQQEMWSGNMYWTAANKPKPGTKYLMRANGLSVVVAMGYETGPGNAARLGGVQGEVMWALGINNTSTAQLGRLKDQSLPYGPVICKE